MTVTAQGQTGSVLCCAVLQTGVFQKVQQQSLESERFLCLSFRRAKEFRTLLRLSNFSSETVLLAKEIVATWLLLNWFILSE